MRRGAAYVAMWSEGKGLAYIYMMYVRTNDEAEETEANYWESCGNFIKI